MNFAPTGMSRDAAGSRVIDLLEEGGHGLAMLLLASSSKSSLQFAERNERHRVIVDIRKTRRVYFSGGPKSVALQQVRRKGCRHVEVSHRARDLGASRDGRSLSESGRHRSAAAGRMGTATAGKTGQRERGDHLVPGQFPLAGFEVTTVGRRNYTLKNVRGARQAQFRQRLAHGLQTLFSYTCTWAYTTDDVSSDVFFVSVPPGVTPWSQERGPSDHDIRQTLAGAVSYDTSGRGSGVLKAFLGNWSTDSIICERSAAPVNG